MKTYLMSPLLFMLGSCAMKPHVFNPATIDLLDVREANKRHLMKLTGENLLIMGYAKNAKEGAIITGNGVNIIVTQLDKWPEELHGSKVKVRGMLHSKFYPVSGYDIGWNAIPQGRVFYINNYEVDKTNAETSREKGEGDEK